MMGLPLICTALLIYILGNFGHLESLEYFSLLLLLFGLALYYGGKPVMRQLLFPISFLLFMFPVPSSLYAKITSPLKIWISKISAEFIDAVGISVFREGNILHLANISLEVTEACSGVRSIITFLVTGVFLAYLSRSLAARAALLISVLPISFLINFMRITGTAILAHYFGSSVAQGFYHEFTGAIMFATGVMMMLLVFHFFYVRGRRAAKRSKR
jgi:exosortase